MNISQVMTQKPFPGFVAGAFYMFFVNTVNLDLS